MARRSSVLLSCLAAATLAGGCAHVVGGIAAMPPTEGPYLHGMDVDDLLLTTPEMRDLTGAGLDLNGIPGMDSKYTVDDELLVEAAPPECQFVFLESMVFGPDVQAVPQDQLSDTAEVRAAVRGRGRLRRRPHRAPRVRQRRRSREGVRGHPVGLLVRVRLDRRRSDIAGRGPRRLRAHLPASRTTVLIEVTYCGYSHVVPDLVATRIAARVGAR